MAKSAPALHLGNISIRQLDGLFYLNDLHVAAGNESRHQPHDFLRIEQTKALLNELLNSGDSRNYCRTIRGRNGGTYVCRELVIAYQRGSIHPSISKCCVLSLILQPLHRPQHLPLKHPPCCLAKKAAAPCC